MMFDIISSPMGPSLTPSLMACLPDGKFKAFAQYAAHSRQVPEDMVVAALLGAVNVAINGKYVIVRENGHAEAIQLYLLIIAEPGERKSAVLNLAKAPSIGWQNRLLERDLSARRLYFDDVSGSALIRALDMNNGCLSCFEAEATILKTTSQTNFPKALLCKAYDGESIDLDRSGKRSVHINDTAISLCVFSQPEIAHEFARKPDVAEIGLLGRMLFIQPASMVGRRSGDTPDIPQESKNYYETLICRLLDVSRGTQRDVLRLDQDAERCFRNFYKRVESEQSANGALGFDKAWGAKLLGKVLRMAGLLHCIEESEPTLRPISSTCIRQSIAMANVFVDHARQFFFHAQHGKTLRIAKHVHTWALQRFGNFNSKEAANAFPEFTIREINAALNLLLEMGLVYEDYSAFQAACSMRPGRNAPPRYLARGGWFQ